MKNLKLGLLLFVFVAFTGNQTVNAQNKIENKQKIQATNVDTELNRVKIEKRIENMEEEMLKASPEDQVQMQNKIDAYRLKNGIEDKATIRANKEAQLQKRAQMIQGNPGIDKAGYEAMLTRKKLESSAKQIEIAKAKLSSAKMDGSLSKDKIQQHELKIQSAEKELKEANIALDKKIGVLKQEHMQNKSIQNK